MIRKNMTQKKTTIEDLAQMIAKGFEQTATKEDFKHLDNRMDNFEGRMDNFEGRMDNFELELSHANARLSTIESDIADIKRDMVNRNEFEDLMGRVKYLEIKLGIESGK